MTNVERANFALTLTRKLMGRPADSNPPEIPPPFTAFDLFVPERHWAIARCTPRSEKKLAEFCQSRNVPYYLPLREHRSANGTKYIVPVFDGFLFVSHPLAADAHDIQSTRTRASNRASNGMRFPARDAVRSNTVSHVFLKTICDHLQRETRHTCGFIFTTDQARLRAELRLLATETQTTRTLQPASSFPEGSRVHIAVGPLTGLEAVVVREAERHPRDGGRYMYDRVGPGEARIFVEMQMLGQVFSMAFKPEMLTQ